MALYSLSKSSSLHSSWHHIPSQSQSLAEEASTDLKSSQPSAETHHVSFVEVFQQLETRLLMTFLTGLREGSYLINFQFAVISIEIEDRRDYVICPIC